MSPCSLISGTRLRLDGLLNPMLPSECALRPNVVFFKHTHHEAEPFFKGNLTLTFIIETGPRGPLRWRRGAWTWVGLATSYSRRMTDPYSFKRFLGVWKGV